MDDEGRRRAIRTFSFDRCKRGNQGFSTILLQLFGFAGHGKSSFINSVLCVWSNSQYQNKANASGSNVSQTTERLTYPLTKNIVLVDNMGCSKMNSYETGEIFAQLANLLPLDKPVDWSKGFKLSDRIVEAEPYVRASDFIIPVFVYSVQKLPTPQDKEELKEILHTATRLTSKCPQIQHVCMAAAVVPIVVLTHWTHKNYTQVETIFKDIGTEKFFHLENYTEKNPKRKKETDEAIIQFLYEVISDAEFRASYPRDTDQEMIDRKLFVLRYIYNRELMIQKQNLDTQRYVESKGADQALRLREEEEEKARRKSRELLKEKLEKMQGEFQRQLLREQHEHEERMRELEKKGKNRKSK